MATIRWISLLGLVLISACSAPANLRHNTVLGAESIDLGRKAVVVLASDIREETSLRKDIMHMGDIYFRRVDETYLARSESDYDFGIEYSLAADWAALSGEDKNRAPKVFVIDPGVYVLEKVNVGSKRTTMGSGFDPKSGSANFGVFEVQASEVVNLGRLVIHMHYYAGYFSARVDENTSEAKEVLSDIFPNLVPRMTNRALKVTQSLPFQ